MPDESKKIIASLLSKIRREIQGQRALLLQTVDYMRKMEQRLDSRMVATRDDLELMLKSELMCRSTRFKASQCTH